LRIEQALIVLSFSVASFESVFVISAFK